MKNRDEELAECTINLLEKRFIYSADQIQEIYNENEIPFTKRYLNQHKQLFQEAEYMQQKHEKGNIQYICISYLRSSIYTKTHNFRTDLYDASFYLDDKELYCNWKPDIIMDYFENDITFVLKDLNKKIPHIYQYEIEKIRQAYSYQYFYLVQKFCRDKIQDLVSFILNTKIQFNKNFLILYGGYMEKSVILYEN